MDYKKEAGPCKPHCYNQIGMYQLTVLLSYTRHDWLCGKKGGIHPGVDFQYLYTE